MYVCMYVDGSKEARKKDEGWKDGGILGLKDGRMRGGWVDGLRDGWME